jgi:hypothetical protein
VLQLAGAAALLALIAAAVAGAKPATQISLLTLAGLSVWLSGAYLKYVLVTRAGFNQGFTLAHLPVRGARS